MKDLKSDAESFKRQFSKWDAALKKAGHDSLEKLYTKVHDEIKKNPARVKKEKKKNPIKYSDKKKTIIEVSGGKKYRRDRRLTNEERKKRVEQKIAKATA